MSLENLYWLSTFATGWAFGVACGISFITVLRAIFDAKQRKAKAAEAGAEGEL